MANLIKIKRSTGTATPPSLAEGELAVSFLSGKLFVGNTTAVIPIGGVHSPGTLTANQALVANATSGIDKVIVANLVPTIITANGALGTDGQILVSNSTGGVYWGSPAASALNDLTDVTISTVANNQLLVYDADSSQFENHSISGNSGQVNVAFNSQDITVSLESNVVIDTLLTVGNSSVNAVVNSTSVTTSNLVATNTITVGSDVTVNTTSFFVGNSTVNAVVNSSSVTTSNLVATNTITVGSNVTVNTSTIFVGNSTVNTTIQAGNIALQGAQLSLGSNVVLNDSSLSIGNTSVNTSINSTSITAINVFSTAINTASIFVSTTAEVVGEITARANVTVNGALVVANTAELGNTTITGIITVGNSTVNSVINSTSLSATSLLVGSNVVVNTSAFFVGNSSVNAVLTATTLDVDGTVTATNGSFVDLSVSGNLTVTGTLTTIDTVNLVVKDPLIKLANNNSTDLVDVGLYGVYGDGGTKYTAFFRDQSDGGTYKLLSGLTVEPTTVVDLTSGVLAPLDVGALDATSLSLSTDLAVEHGGTGVGTFTTRGVIYGNGTSALQVTAAGTDGQVLQANSTGFPVFADLDGGTF